VIPAPPPGIYPDVPEAEYRAWDAVNASLLVDLRDMPPARARHRLLNRKLDTEATLLGRTLHLVMLQPELLARYTVSPPFLRNYRDEASVLEKTGRVGVGGKREAEEFDERVEREGLEVIEHDVYETAVTMRDAALCDPQVRRILSAPDNVRELSVVWQDRATGLPCKMRIDIGCSLFGRPHIIDLKSARDAGRAMFGRQIESLGHHIRAAHYLEGARVSGLFDDPAYAWLVQDKPEPYLCAFYYADAEIDLVDGEEERARLTRVWAHCQETDSYPGHTVDGAPSVCTRPGYARWERMRKLGLHGRGGDGGEDWL